jgi:hypothetical protein
MSCGKLLAFVSGRGHFRSSTLGLLMVAGASPALKAGSALTRPEQLNHDVSLIAGASRLSNTLSLSGATTVSDESSRAAAGMTSFFCDLPSATGPVYSPLFSDATGTVNAPQAPAPMSIQGIQWLAFERPVASIEAAALPGPSQVPAKRSQPVLGLAAKNATPIPLLPALRSGLSCVAVLSALAAFKRARRVLR